MVGRLVVLVVVLLGSSVAKVWSAPSDGETTAFTTVPTASEGAAR